MADKFYNIHLVQASLQAFDVPMPEIEEFLTSFESLASSPESFATWNQELDAKGIQVLRMLLGGNGRELGAACLQGLFTAMVSHYGLTESEIVSAMRERIKRYTRLN